ncbi:hypothetical protein OG909_20470 [Streptomyces sp. NBC_01754]|uniref:DUF6716 putative glycosyltransferase n=1 Tax=Streptomyces sp. NBC_01754 TaxID=2975930 RepID=UPI002DD9E668|nr:DUF6716 putative glycosyltransferase [Streptomyces sp. NBC_01754]WSC94456.1 hypothetical protein OG909_20470 [Streptomyces sp. NBC_01754]
MPPRTSDAADPAHIAATGRPALRVAVLADSDTRWKWGALTARRLTAPGTGSGGDARPAEISGLLLRGRATPTPRQLAEAGEAGADTDRVREVTAAGFLHAVRDEGYDVVVLALVGGAVQAMLHGLAALRLPRRPVLVTGYVGVVYEKLADGLLLRHGADVVLANSRHDAERFRTVYEGVGADASAVTEAALPFLGGEPYRPEEGRDTVVFAAQPSVPASRAERTYLLRRLVGHALLHPDREVLLKLRSKPGEHTTHIEELPYQRLAERLPGGAPPNLRLVYGHMGGVLDRTDLLVTVSSTAALESLHRGVPTAVLSDLGVREALGNHHFVGSGLITSWDRLDGGHRPRPDEEWLAGQGVAAGGAYATAYDTARARVADLLAAGPLPGIAPYYTPASAPGYLPGVLARHHLDPEGRPMPGAMAPREPGRVRGAVRGTVRNAARGAYRHGVQRVAPVIRRMGEL